MAILLLLWLLSLIALIVLCVKGLRLAFRPAVRAEACRRWLRTSLTFGFLAAAAVPCVWIAVSIYLSRVEADAYRASTTLRLDAPTRLGGLDFPAGTQLRLRTPHLPDSFIDAEFPAPQRVHGVLTRRISRDVDRMRTTLMIAAENPTVVDGWHCLASPNELNGAALRLVLADDGQSVRLDECRAAEGNLLDGHPIPVNSTITATGPRQLDGRWRVSAPYKEMVVLHGVPVFKASFLLDDARRLSFVEHGELACRLSLGDFVYPVGTEIESADGDWRMRAPDAWMFITTANRQALRKGEALAGGDWVVQSLDGRLHDVIPAAQTRRPFARFKIEGVREPRPPSPESSCGEMMSSTPAATLAPQAPTLQ